MNIYGDWGNVLTIIRRAEWHGYTPKLIEYNPGDDFPEDFDILIGGGGQDAGQNIVQNNLHSIAPNLQRAADLGAPMLAICGLYQLFGNFFKTKDGEIIKGIGIFDIETHGGSERLTGNLVTTNEQFGAIIGYENHSGKTFLGKSAEPFGTIIKGAGNNGQDDFEGARYNNMIGSYMHGSMLPKNPQVADWLLETAAVRKYDSFEPMVIDDRFADEARRIAAKRPR